MDREAYENCKNLNAAARRFGGTSEDDKLTGKKRGKRVTISSGAEERRDSPARRRERPPSADRSSRETRPGTRTKTGSAGSRKKSGNAEGGGGGGGKDAEPAAVLRVAKKRGIYTFTMNPMRDDGLVDASQDPATIRLETVGGSRASLDSASSYDFDIVPPCAIEGLRPPKSVRNAQTSYEPSDFMVPEKKKGEKKTLAADQQKK